MMKRIILLMLIVTAYLPVAYAKTINCPTCSQSDFEFAVYAQSAPGDTIVLPAGSATWGNYGRFNHGIIYITTPNLTIVGQGDSTVITLDDSGATYANGVIALWTDSTFSKVKIIGSSAAPVTAFQIVPYGSFAGGFRLTDITYIGGVDGYFAYTAVNSGLIDHCRITGNVGYAELIFGRGPIDAWQKPNTMGGPNNIFIEDNTFINTGYVCDANSNAGYVIRYNTIQGLNKVDGHGIDSNSPPRSVRNMEVYGNNWTMNGAGNWANIEIRGGTCMIFDNTSAVGWFFLTDYAYQSEPTPWPNYGFAADVVAGNPTTINTNAPHHYKTGWPIFCQEPKNPIYGFYPITVTGTNSFTIPVNNFINARADFVTTYKTPYDYPTADQIGVGQDPKAAASEPAYVFHNLQGVGPWPRVVQTVCPDALVFYRAQTGNPSATFTERDVVQSNRDFFADAGFDTNTGASRGTAAQMHALTPTVVGYGFWVTDEGEWNSNHAGPDGRLYVWNGSAWVLYYMPYAYPHPLQGGILPPPSPPAAPTPPSNVKITITVH